MTSERNPYFDATTQGGPSRSAAPDAPDEPAGTATAPWTGTGTAPTTILNPPTPDRELPPEILPPSLARTVRFRSLGERQPSSIRLRRGPDNAARAPSLNTIPFDSELQTQSQQDAEGQSNVDNNGGRFSFGRRRASSDARSRRGSQALPLSGLPTIPDAAQGHETGGSAPVGVQDRPHFTEPVHAAPVQTGPNGATAVGLFIRNEYKSDIVDFLDVVDPEVATLSSITNVQNSLFVPSLGRFINRRPTYDLSFARRIPGAFPELPDGETEVPTAPVSRQTTLNRTFSITSEITPAHYAVLPSGTSLEGWSREDVDQINDHVRHMLHSRRARMKRSLKAFGKYVRRPLGFFVTLYATLITLFGLAWVLFLIGWIYVGDKQLYAINVIDNILVALFAVVGDGLAPFRAVDTYHLIFIVRYRKRHVLLHFLPDRRKSHLTTFRSPHVEVAEKDGSAQA
ncbi:MAG: hypothetical protein JWP44_5057 [Mucilaginibacter sp.]|nr:hypothetical protein [Mucilaginibacter sp.]